MDAKQLSLALIEFLHFTLRQDADRNGMYSNGAQYRLDLALSSVQARISDKVHDEDLDGIRYSPKTLLMVFCKMMCDSLGLERDPFTKQITHATDSRIHELFQKTLGRLQDGEFDSLIGIFESMASEQHPPALRAA